MNTTQLLKQQAKTDLAFALAQGDACAEDAASERIAQIKDGCEGHPAGPGDPMGETVYCDGTCR